MAKEIYRPGEMKRLVNCTVFGPKEDVGDYPVYMDMTGKSREQVQAAVKEFAESVKGTVYTGILKENNWSRTAWWEKGRHLVNRTGEYAVVW